MLVALSQVFKQLVKDGKVVRNIVEDVDRVPDTPKKFATHTPAQVERVLRTIREDRNRHAGHLALYGLRRGEIGGLRWTNIDLEAKTLTVGPTRISVDGKASVRQRSITYCGPTGYVFQRPPRTVTIRPDSRAFVTGKWRLSKDFPQSAEGSGRIGELLAEDAALEALVD
jgi:integrase